MYAIFGNDMVKTAVEAELRDRGYQPVSPAPATNPMKVMLDQMLLRMAALNLLDPATQATLRAEFPSLWGQAIRSSDLLVPSQKMEVAPILARLVAIATQIGAAVPMAVGSLIPPGIEAAPMPMVPSTPPPAMPPPQTGVQQVIQQVTQEQAAAQQVMRTSATPTTNGQAVSGGLPLLNRVLMGSVSLENPQVRYDLQREFPSTWPRLINEWMALTPAQQVDARPKFVRIVAIAQQVGAAIPPEIINVLPELQVVAGTEVAGVTVLGRVMAGMVSLTDLEVQAALRKEFPSTWASILREWATVPVADRPAAQQKLVPIVSIARQVHADVPTEITSLLPVTTPPPPAAAPPHREGEGKKIIEAGGISSPMGWGLAVVGALLVISQFGRRAS